MGKKVGFVPTMGALHPGHLALIKEAKKRVDIVVSSIFVNPKQFDKKEDLDKYPRQEEKDVELLKQAGCDIIYIPDEKDIYTSTHKNIPLDIHHLEKVYEGEKRKGHFDGVVQVLYQLFDIVKPNIVLFGQKDYQQCLVVKSILKTYFKQIEMVICPTIRNKEGLALSSRNQRLSQKGLNESSYLNKGLNLAITLYERFVPEQALAFAKTYMESNAIEIEYIDFADADTLKSFREWEEIPKNKIIVVAAYVEGVRLIDNMLF